MTQTMQLDEGDRVAYRACFLRSIGDYSAQLADRRGKLSGHTCGPLVEVLWDDGHEGMVHNANLIRADRIHLEPS